MNTQEIHTTLPYQIYKFTSIDPHFYSTFSMCPKKLTSSTQPKIPRSTIHMICSMFSMCSTNLPFKANEMPSVIHMICSTFSTCSKKLTSQSKPEIPSVIHTICSTFSTCSKNLPFKANEMPSVIHMICSTFSTCSKKLTFQSEPDIPSTQSAQQFSTCSKNLPLKANPKYHLSSTRSAQHLVHVQKNLPLLRKYHDQRST